MDTESESRILYKMSCVQFGYAPYGKMGAGNYGSNWGRESSSATGLIRDKVIELAKSIPFTDPKSVFNIGDYGTADGAASMTFIRDLIITLREQHGYKIQFQIIYEDQPISDFNSLFNRLSGKLPDPPSYLLELDNVYPLASGIHFRKQCVPSGSMHLIMSFIAVHWLSKPITFKESLYIYPDSTQEEREALYQQGREDWETFLLMRSRELKSGGILVVSTDGEHVDENGTHTISTELFIGLLTKVWRSFRDAGRITKAEFTNTNLAACMYPIQLLREPFNDRASPVSHSGLRLVSAEVLIKNTVFYNAWKHKMDATGVDDREEFARRETSAHRSWSNSTFLTGLSDSRPLQEKEAIVDDLYMEVEQRMRAINPEEFENACLYSCVIILKE